MQHEITSLQTSYLDLFEESNRTEQLTIFSLTTLYGIMQK